MASTTDSSKWFRVTVAIAVAVVSATTATSVYVYKKKSRHWTLKIRELEDSLKHSNKKCAAERKGRIRAQQTIQKALSQGKAENPKANSYPMTPIAVVESCFSTRNGTPRQPLLVPLSRACLVFDTSQVPPAALDGLAEYSHCWILYVFHLNTNADKVWGEPANFTFKAKVRVPKLMGGKMGVFATRSPHRPCPIGLTLAKVEARQGHILLLSGVDLVDGTPVLDIKPYLPFCESIPEALVPQWVKEDNKIVVASVHFADEFVPSLTSCWASVEKKSLYASPEEFQRLVKQVLSFDIRSVSQRRRPHKHKEVSKTVNNINEVTSDLEDEIDEEISGSDVTYHLTLEGLEISYKIDTDGNVLVEKSALSSYIKIDNQNRSGYMLWKDTLG
ncbi:hypothetical protein MKX03_015511 [Papaver bracteatum]|nr:hypothetical protein MKX03_015511 [Papaver bracteatum]